MTLPEGIEIAKSHQADVAILGAVPAATSRGDAPAWRARGLDEKERLGGTCLNIVASHEGARNLGRTLGPRPAAGALGVTSRGEDRSAALMTSKRKAVDQLSPALNSSRGSARLGGPWWRASAPPKPWPST